MATLSTHLTTQPVGAHSPIAAGGSRPQPRTRRPGGGRSQAPVGSTGDGTDAFLKNARFQPVWVVDQAIYPRTEAHALRSLGHAAAAYGITLPPSAAPFPQNVIDQMAALRTHLGPYHGLQLRRDDQHIACVTRTFTFDTGPGTYFLFLKPVARLRRRSYSSRLVQLIGSVLAYFFDTVKLPGLHDSDGWLVYEGQGYIDEQEQQIAEMDKTDPDEWKEAKQELAYRKRLVRREQQRVANLYQWLATCSPSNIPTLLAQYRPRTTFGATTVAVARQVNALYTTFGHKTMGDCFAQSEINEDDCYIEPERYMGILWDEASSFTNYLCEGLDAEFNSGSIPFEPMMTHYFDHSGPVPHPFTFTTPLFRALAATQDLLAQLV